MKFPSEALAEVYNVNNVTVLNSAGETASAITSTGEILVSGYELASRIAKAKQRVLSIQRGIAGCEALLNGAPAK